MSLGGILPSFTAFSLLRSSARSLSSNFPSNLTRESSTRMAISSILRRRRIAMSRASREERASRRRAARRKAATRRRMTKSPKKRRKVAVRESYPPQVWTVESMAKNGESESWRCAAGSTNENFCCRKSKGKVQRGCHSTCTSLDLGDLDAH